MKFSELTAQQWQEWATYLDTCVLPITGLTGEESPVEAAASLDRLRNWLEEVEIRFRGRVVTYPAYHFILNKQPQRQELLTIEGICSQLRKRGFSYIVIISAAVPLTKNMIASADEVFTPIELPCQPFTRVQQEMNRRIQQMWSPSPTVV